METELAEAGPSQSPPQETLTTTVDKLYKEIKRIIADGKLTPANVIVVVMTLMRFIELNAKDVSGVQKRDAICHALKHYVVNDMVDEPAIASILNLFIDTTLPPLIDNMIRVAKGEFKIKNIRRCCGLLK